MADKDNRQGPFKKVFHKHAGRAKERVSYNKGAKLLQNLGKADRTTDEDFDVYVKNFSRQHTAVVRLQKEFKNYYQSLKTMQACRKSLLDTVCELYEPCWTGLDQFLVKTEVSSQNFEDFCDKIDNQILTPVASYISQFPEINNKISKRNRKMLDYDNCRHNFQNLESMKRREEMKLSKAKEQLDDARSLFELINSELHDELPALYESRVSFFVSHLQCLFLAEAHFHNQDSGLFVELNSILEALDEAHKKGVNCFGKPKVPDVGSLTDTFPDTKFSPVKSEEFTASDDHPNNVGSSSASGDGTVTVPQTSAATDRGTDTVSDITEELLAEINPDEHNVEDTPAAEHRILYQVQGTYKYAAEDSDELSFDVGDVIDVIAYDDPEEQEEGWLMGVFDGKKGLFPANFTSRI